MLDWKIDGPGDEAHGVSLIVQAIRNRGIAVRRDRNARFQRDTGEFARTIWVGQHLAFRRIFVGRDYDLGDGA